jgi:hypothetical protein
MAMKKYIFETEEAMELALVTSLLISNEVIDGTFFNTFDRHLEIAKAFLKRARISHTLMEDLDFEEVVYQFGKEYSKENKWII